MKRYKLNPCGDAEIDCLRESFLTGPATDANYNERRGVLLRWTHLLQRRGADLSSYVDHYDVIRLAERHSEKDKLYPAVDRAFELLNGIQALVTDAAPDGNDRIVCEACQEYDPGDGLQDWPMYGGGPDSAGARDGGGPSKGMVAWKKPVGLAWYARPVVDGGRIYAAGPGLRTMLYCLDCKSGAVIWKTTRPWHPDLRQYGTPGTACTPLVLKDTIVLLELGAQGKDFGQRHIVYINKADGRLLNKVPAGELDYRAGYAAFDGNERFLVLPYCTHQLGRIPPHFSAPNMLYCVDTATGGRQWDMLTGPVFSEPLINDGCVYVGSQDGAFYCMRLEPPFNTPSTHNWYDKKRFVWQFNARDAINSTALVSGGSVYFGDNSGRFYCLDKADGALRWQTDVPHEPRAFKLFSTALQVDNEIYVGTANKRFYVLDANSGKIKAEAECPDWIRSRPAAEGGRLFVQSMDGTLTAFELDGLKKLWQIKIGTHPVYADPVAKDGCVYVNSSDLWLWCIDAQTGALRWRHSLIESIDLNGTRIFADEMCCGGFFQSKPTAAGGLVYYGTPSRFVVAVDHRSGREVWRYEMGGAVSGAPAVAGGRIYAGQQGGEEYFYCLDAGTGYPLWRQALSWVWSSAKVDGDAVLVPGCDGYFNCLDAATGAIRWRYRSGRAAHPEPAVADGRVYFGSWDHWAYCFDIATGKMLWRFYTAGSPDSGAPCCGEGKLFLPAIGDTLYCMDAATGKVLWTFSKPLCSMNGAVAYHDGRVYASRNVQVGAVSLSAAVTCLDAATGLEIWEHAGGGLTPAVIAGGKACFASTASAFFTCVETKGNGDGTARQLWLCRMGDRIDECAPALYGGKAYVISADGFLYAVE